jgi:hypothetical protein
MMPAFEPSNDLAVHWPSATPAVVPLLAQLGARALLTEPAGLAPGLVAACAQAKLLLVADIAEEPDLTALRKALVNSSEAGFQAAAVHATGEAPAFGKLAQEFRDTLAFVYLSPEQIGWDVKPAHAVLRYGTWPGIATPDPGVASATESIWLDANTSLIAQLRAQYPNRHAILGFRPDKQGGVPETRSVPFRSAEVALADSFSAGGSVILSLPNDYRKALLAGDARAVEAWTALAGVRAFIQGASDYSSKPLAGRTAVLCGTIEQSGEILNLAFRRNLCPVALSVDTPGPLSPGRFDIVVAANVIPSPAVVKSLIGYATAGGAILATPAGEEKDNWWTTHGLKKVRAEDDRDVYSTGKGTIYAYHSAVADPGEFALDLKELAGHRSQPELGVKNFDLRIWSADSVLGVLHRVSPTSVALVLTAYGNLRRGDFLVGVRGKYRKASLRQAGGTGPVAIHLMPRAGRVEINLTEMSRIAIVLLEE